jgi:hypothetical protein
MFIVIPFNAAAFTNFPNLNQVITTGTSSTSQGSIVIDDNAATDQVYQYFWLNLGGA